MAQQVDLEPVSNREDWDDTFELVDDDGAALDLSDVSAMVLIVWDDEHRSTVLAASLNNGITVADVAGGVISIHFPASAMSALCAESYAYRLGMTKGGATKDLAFGTLPVIDGGPN
jgi:hypothetical protein